MTKLPAAPAGAASTAPTPGRTVVPGDFAGRYRLFANGLWSGVLELKVGAAGAVSGEFRSDLNGTAYPVTGQVAADVPHKVVFRVTYPRVRQDFEGLLWAEGKGAMAGTLTMLDHAYGFFALREGGRIAPEDVEVGTPPTPGDRGKDGRRVVTVRKDRTLLDGKALSGSEITERLKGAVAADPATSVLLIVPEEIHIRRRAIDPPGHPLQRGREDSTGPGRSLALMGRPSSRVRQDERFLRVSQGAGPPRD